MNAISPGARRARSIMIPVAVLMAALTVAGFWRSYFRDLLLGSLETEWYFHVHAAVAMGWIALVILQAYWAYAGRIALHMAVGRIGMAYGVVVIVASGWFSLFIWGQQVAAGNFERVQRGLVAPLTDLGVFAIGLAGAWLYRRQPERHKRFIVVATSGLIVAGVTRLPILNGTRSIAPLDVALFVLVGLSPLLLAMAYDYWRHRRVHGVYVLGLALMIALRYRELLRNTDAWLSITTWLKQWFV